MVFTLSIVESIVKAEFAAPEPSFEFDLASVVDLTLFVQAICDFKEPIATQPSDLTELITVKPEDSDDLRKSRKLVEYLGRIVDSFNLAFNDLMVGKSAVVVKEN